MRHAKPGGNAMSNPVGTRHGASSQAHDVKPLMPQHGFDPIHTPALDIKPPMPPCQLRCGRAMARPYLHLRSLIPATMYGRAFGTLLAHSVSHSPTPHSATTMQWRIALRGVFVGKPNRCRRAAWVQCIASLPPCDLVRFIVRAKRQAVFSFLISHFSRASP